MLQLKRVAATIAKNTNGEGVIVNSYHTLLHQDMLPWISTTHPD
jgi:hypothetical protein